ncbi:DUF1700 domain-containing protein [Lentilactobacillus otakiensis]|uniref:DUF1700 domain-containing protein n=1 Tax=Lentilactobacillus otakiensis TaxID=481720 RepID=UPI003D16FDAF
MNDYIEEFRALLGQLSPEERDEAVDFYTEYLQDGGYDSYDDCIRELGTPHQLARKVLADYSIRTLETPTSAKSRKQQPKNDVKTIWLIILALLSTPVTIPLALGLAGLIFAAIVVSGSLIVAVLAIFFAIIVVGITGFVVGLGTLFSSFWTGIFYVGMGLMVIGVLIMLTPLFKKAINALIRGITLFSKWIYNKIVPKNRAERKEKGDRK